MKKHKMIILISAIIGSIMIALVIYGYINHLEDMTVGSITLSVFLTLWSASFPTSLYATYRLISSNTKTGFWLDRFISAVHGGIFGGVFWVPFILGPIMLPTYIQFYKRDRRQFNTI